MKGKTEKLDAASKQRLLKAWNLEEKAPAVLCDRCNGPIKICKIREEYWESNCPCGKYKGSFKGI